MKVNKILASVLTFAMLISLMPMASMAAESEYHDTNAHWAKSEINKWSDYGILKGNNGEFRPDAPITRAEMAIILDRVMKYQSKAKNTFSDLSDTWYTEAILRGNAAGIVKGDGISVRPMDNITRQEASVMLCRALNLSEQSGPTTFADDAMLASWAKGYVKALSAKGLIAGMGENSFAPTENITRAAVVKMLDNAIRGFYNVEGVMSGNIDGTVVVNSDKVTLKNMTINGDLIIAEGVGSGEVTLDSVTVKGQTVVRGGGPNSIKVQGESNLGKVIVQKKEDGTVSIKVTGNAKVDVVVAEDGTINVSGEVSSLEVKGEVAVNLVGASIKTINVEGTAELAVDKGSKVDALNVSGPKTEIAIAGTVGTVTTAVTASGALISTEAGAKVSTIVAKAEGTKISGAGTVTNVKAEGNNVAVSTPNTKVDAAPGTSGVTAGGTAVTPGQSSTTGGSTTPSGGGGSGNDSDTTNPLPIHYTFRTTLLLNNTSMFNNQTVSAPYIQICNIKNEEKIIKTVTELLNINQQGLENAIEIILVNIKNASWVDEDFKLTTQGEKILTDKTEQYNSFRKKAIEQAEEYIVMDLGSDSYNAFIKLLDSMKPESIILSKEETPIAKEVKTLYYQNFKLNLETFFLELKKISPAGGNQNESKMVTFVADKLLEYYSTKENAGPSITYDGKEIPLNETNKQHLVNMIGAIRRDVTIKEWADAIKITKLSFKYKVAAENESLTALNGEYILAFELIGPYSSN